MAQAKLKTDSVTEVRVAAQKLFGAIDAAQPEGVRYAWILHADGETFAALVQVDDGVDNPIPALPEFQELQQAVDGSLAEAADVLFAVVALDIAGGQITHINSVANPDKLTHLKSVPGV